MKEEDLVECGGVGGAGDLGIESLDLPASMLQLVRNNRIGVVCFAMAWELNLTLTLTQDVTVRVSVSVWKGDTQPATQLTKKFELNTQTY